MRKSIQLREEEDLEKMMSYAGAAGFSEIALSFGSSDVLFRPDADARIFEIGELLAKNGLRCTQTHLPFYHLLKDAAETTEEMERAIKKCIKFSAQLGASWTAYHPRTDIADGYHRTGSFAYNRRYLSQYLEEAERYGVGIAVENMPLYPYTHPEWRFFGGGYEELVELCDAFSSKYIGICWDFGHAHTAALDQAAALCAVGDRLKITHVHDNYKNGDHHQLPLLASLEWGSIDWGTTVRALRKIAYQGPMTLEVITPPEPMRKSFVQCGFDALSALLD